MHNNAQDVWGQFQNFDLVIDATGQEMFSAALNHYARSKRRDDRYPPVLYAMIFGNGIAVQTFLEKGGVDDACYKCLKPHFDRDWRYTPLKVQARETKIVTRPCSEGSFTPYGVEASITAASLALRHTLDYFESKTNSTLRTRTIDNERGKNLNDKAITPAHDCPECAN